MVWLALNIIAFVFLCWCALFVVGFLAYYWKATVTITLWAILAFLLLMR